MGKKIASKWRRRLADALELPREIVLNLARLTVIGNLQCYIENHRGVIEYSGDCVRVALNSGEIMIRGQDLVIRYMANEEIAIDGTIEMVQFEQ